MWWNGAFEAYLVYSSKLYLQEVYYPIHENFPLEINPLYSAFLHK